MSRKILTGLFASAIIAGPVYFAQASCSCSG
jgi:hypothetical protein